MTYGIRSLMTFEELIKAIGKKPYYQDEAVAIYHGDCREILPLIPDKSVDLVLTDPPYPNQHKEYGSSNIAFLNSQNCRQLVFWEAMAEFPLSYTAIHIWHKKTPVVAYERIFERNGSTKCKLYSYYFINSTVAASYVHDIFTGHPSQKPQKLISQLINEYSNPNELLLDPFLGSGTTAYCAKKLNRFCIGIEINEKYCEVAAKRCSQMVFPLK